MLNNQGKFGSKIISRLWNHPFGMFPLSKTHFHRQTSDGKLSATYHAY